MSNEGGGVITRRFDEFIQRTSELKKAKESVARIERPFAIPAVAGLYLLFNVFMAKSMLTVSELAKWGGDDLILRAVAAGLLLLEIGMVGYVGVGASGRHKKLEELKRK